MFFFFHDWILYSMNAKKWTNVKVQRGWGLEIGSKSQLPTPTTWCFALHTLVSPTIWSICSVAAKLSVLVTRGPSVNAFRSLFALLLNWPV